MSNVKIESDFYLIVVKSYGQVWYQMKGLTLMSNVKLESDFYLILVKSYGQVCIGNQIPIKLDNDLTMGYIYILQNHT